MKHFKNLKDYKADDIEKIINYALDIKTNSDAYSDSLLNKKIYLLFEKTSTRTAVSFEVGINELGGQFYTQKWSDSNFIVAEICDEVRYLGRNVDMIIARLKENKNIDEMAKYSTVPVINGCCNKFHPCQAMADVLTVKELFGSFKIKLLYIGVKNNVYNSLILSLPKLGCDFYSVTPISNEQSKDELVSEFEKNSSNVHNFDSNNLSNNRFKELVNEVDVIYTDTWIDMEFFNEKNYREEKNKRIEIMTPFQLNASLLKDAKAKIFHDMPIHTGFEIDRETVEKNIDIILRQSENRRHAQKAIMLDLLK